MSILKAFIVYNVFCNVLPAFIFIIVLQARPLVASLFIKHDAIYQVTLPKRQEVSQHSRQWGTIVLLLSLKRKILVPEFESVFQGPPESLWNGNHSQVPCFRGSLFPSYIKGLFVSEARQMLYHWVLSPTSYGITQHGTNMDRDKDYLEMTVSDHPMSRSILRQIRYLLATSFMAIYGLELI